jgi:GT2 family glycosyltransferase
MASCTQDGPLISIIVVNWNGIQFLDECLASLMRQTWLHREFVLVDNGSKDGSAECMRQWAEQMPRTQAIFLSQNTGFCRANNLAFARARGEWVALFNNDAVAEPDWLGELVGQREAIAGLGMLGSKILFQDPAGVIDKAGHLIYWDGQNRGRGTMEPDCGQYDRPEEILWPDACAALYHRKVFEETRGFDESFFAYGDDADLGMRARLLGWKAWYVPTAVVHHRHSATAGAYSPLKIMLVERNRLLLAAKNLPLPLLLQNPFWTLRRFGWYAYAALGRRGSAARFVESQGWGRMLLSLLLSYAGAARLLPGALRQRRQIQRTRRLSNAEVMDLLRRFRLDLRDLTLKD